MEVTTRYHYLRPNLELTERWDNLLFKAYAAKKLGDNITFDKICNIVRTEYASWKSNADAYAKKHTRKGWLYGDGEIYVVVSSDPFDNISMIEIAINHISTDELKRSLWRFK